MKPVDKRPMAEHTPAYLTFPLADEAYQEKDTKESIPDPSMVKEAKDWVDFNEL